MEEVNESLKEELEALEAILSSEDEFTAKENGRSELCVTTRIFPLTASDTSRQYVGLYLKVVLNKSLYPDQEKPRIIDVLQVRGLNETNIQQLLKVNFKLVCPNKFWILSILWILFFRISIPNGMKHPIAQYCSVW